MGKNTIKSTRVAVLMIIMLTFVQMLEADKLCQESCSLQCLGDLNKYFPCFKDCVSKNCQKSTGLSNCAQSCGVNKTITVHIGI